MKTILVRKNKLGFEFCLEPYSTAPTWKRFPQDIQTRADMKEYFAEGKHSLQPRQNIYDLELSFVDQAGKKVKHYKIERDGKLIFAVVDFDRTKKIAVPLSKIWPDPDQLTFLRENANYIPKDISTLKDATEFLAQNEPGTIGLFQAELNRITMERMKEHCQTHAKEYFSADSLIDEG